MNKDRTFDRRGVCVATAAAMVAASPALARDQEAPSTNGLAVALAALLADKSAMAALIGKLPRTPPKEANALWIDEGVLRVS